MSADPLLSEAMSRARAEFQEAAKRVEAGAVTMATVDAAGHPRVRTMLIKFVDDGGIVFFTNRESRKGEDLQTNAGVAVCAYWEHLQRQITIEGQAEPINDEAADAHWSNRSRDNQLAAWASPQSRPLAQREELLQRLREVREQHRNQAVPRPPWWVGYRLQPHRIEFWRASWHRLSERICYEQHADGWRVTLLNP